MRDGFRRKERKGTLKGERLACAVLLRGLAAWRLCGNGWWLSGSGARSGHNRDAVGFGGCGTQGCPRASDQLGAGGPDAVGEGDGGRWVFSIPPSTALAQGLTEEWMLERLVPEG